MSKQAKVVYVVGSIATGKSTLLKQIRELYPNLCVVDESVDVWSGRKDFLPGRRHDFLKEGVGGGSHEYLRLQCIALHSQFQSLLPLVRGETNSIVCERDLSSGLLFARAAEDQGLLTPLDVGIVEHSTSILQSAHPALLRPYAVVHLFCSPAKSLERIKKRGRSSEEVVDINYLNRLHSQHVVWSEANFSPLVPQRVFECDTTTTPFNDPRKIVNALDDVLTR